MLDLLNDRIDINKALAIVAVSNQIVQVAKLELQNREMFYRYQEQSAAGSPAPLRLAGKVKKAS